MAGLTKEHYERLKARHDQDPRSLPDDLHRAFHEYEAERGQASYDALMKPQPPDTSKTASEIVAADQTNPKDLLGVKKAPLRLVPPALMIGAAPAMLQGGQKYGPYNWRAKKVKLSVYLEAMLRHLFAVMDGEDMDPQSGVLHLSHIAANVGIVFDALYGDNLIDDRPTPGPAPEMLAEQDQSRGEQATAGAQTPEPHAPDLPPRRPISESLPPLEERLRVAEEDKKRGGEGAFAVTPEEYAMLVKYGLIRPPAKQKEGFDL